VTIRQLHVYNEWRCQIQRISVYNYAKIYRVIRLLLSLYIYAEAHDCRGKRYKLYLGIGSKEGGKKGRKERRQQKMYCGLRASPFVFVSFPLRRKTQRERKREYSTKLAKEERSGNFVNCI
jgi:hypothetical protein